jgi:3-oxoacyl-[acyl-carrier protein] reductase
MLSSDPTDRSLVETSSMNGRIAIVTGASSGIGRAIAERLGRGKANIVVGYHSEPDQAAEVVKTIEGFGAKSIAVKVNTAKPSDITALYDACEKAFGRPDIVCNNAGVGGMQSLKDATEEEYERIYSINVKGLLFSLKEAATRLNDNGRIVNISSSTTMFVTANLAIYASSKAAIKAMTESAAQEFGVRGVTVDSIMPGLTDTPMNKGLTPELKKMVIDTTPMKRIGQPEDIADVVAFLVSEEARWINGQHILVNGGGKV